MRSNALAVVVVLFGLGALITTMLPSERQQSEQPVSELHRGVSLTAR